MCKASVAWDYPHGVWKPRALHEHVPSPVQGVLLHRRWRDPRQGRLLLDHRARGRRPQRERSPHRVRRNRVGTRRLRRGGRGRRGWVPSRSQGRGHRMLRHHPGWRARDARAGPGPPSADPQRHRPFCDARSHYHYPWAAQDPLGQDHAPRAAQDHLQRGRPARRHLHFGGSKHRGRAHRQGRDHPQVSSPILVSVNPSTVDELIEKVAPVLK
mmetsp:Transcript_8360/g.23751  ORF Transcript_8360/g.23751 Transcript_8360/m.23751 type:complete len:213 (-) Transcript_8360:94-732(-)